MVDVFVRTLAGPIRVSDTLRGLYQLQVTAPPGFEDTVYRCHLPLVQWFCDGYHHGYVYPLEYWRQ